MSHERWQELILVVFLKIILTTFFFSSLLLAEGFLFDLNEIKIGDRVGIFIGTFDPLTKGHESVINAALNSGTLDRIILIANNKPSWKPNVTPIAIRNEMLQARFSGSRFINVYQHEGKVLPAPIKLAMDLRSKFGRNIFIAGIYGGDSLHSKWKLILESMLISFYNEVMIFDRESLGERGFPQTILGKTVKVLLNPEGADSSTSVRRYLNENPSFYFSDANAFENLSQRVDPTILKIIKENNIYANNSNFFKCFKVYTK